jgi:hypothetical protein
MPASSSAVPAAAMPRTAATAMSTAMMVSECGYSRTCQ